MKTKKKNKKKISKVLFSKVARVASLATTVVASEILTSEKAEASITIGETAGSPNNQSVKKTSAAAVSTAIAIGNNANASNSGSAFAIAIGGDTTSTGNGAISIGKDAQSLASSGVAVGYNSKASGGQAVAIGGNIQNAGGAQATGDQSISIGGDTIASGSSSIAIGGDDLNQANSIAGVVFKNLTGVDLIGTTTYIKTESGGAGSIAIGVQSTSSGHLSTAFGTKTKASGAYSTALGVGASSEGEGSIALGGAASSKGKTSIAIGTKVKTVGESATSIGYGAEASSKGAVAIGLDSRAGDGNAATGTAGANGINAVAIGTGAQAIAKNTISIGTGNVVSGVGSGAIGDPTTITGAGTYSLGNDNGNIAASNSGVFGNNNNIKGATSGNRVIGNNNTVEVTANNALIFGNNAGVSAANGIAIGEKSASTSEGSIAFGLNSKAGNGSGATFGLAKDAIAIGTNSSARGDKAVAIGKGTQANHDSNIAIGNSAETGRDLTVSNYDIKNISIGYEAGKGMNGQFNSYLGTNAGQDSKGDGNSAFGLRAGKTVTGNTNTAIGMDSGQNVKASSNTAIGLNAGQNVTANGGGSNVAIGTNAGQNVTTTSSGGGDNIAIGTNAGRNVTSSIGHNTAVGHSAGQNIIGTNNVAFGSGSGQNVVGDNNTSMGINAGIGVKSSSNVSIGSDSGQNTDGVGNTAIGYQAGQKVTGGHNISMGYQSAKGLNGGSNTIIGFQAGQEIVGGNNIIVGTNATKKVTVDNVVSIGTNSTASTNNSVAVGSYSKATGNAAIAIGQGSNASKDNSMAIGNRSTVNAVKDVAIGSDSSTSATTGVSKATITVPGTGKSITYGTFAGSNPDAAFSVGSAGRERQIQNVAAGRVTATSTDAINGSQLFAVANELGKTWKANAGGNLSGSATSTQVMPGDEVQFVAGKNLEVEQNLATGSQKYTYSLKKDVDLGSTGSLKAGPVTINNNGIDAGNKKITNVAPGTADTDAANVSQVKAAKTTVSSDDNSITVTETTKPNGHKNYDLSVDVTKLDAANKSLSNINNDGNKVISDIARKSVDVVAGTNIKNIVKNDVQNLDGTTTTTYTINANGARVVAGDGVTVATGTPGSNNITDYTVSVKNTTLTATPGSTTVTAGDNNSYAKAGDVATAITNAAKAAKTEVKSPDSSINVTTDNTSPDGHTIYNVTIDKSGKVAAGDTKLVTGDTVNTAITNAKTDLINNNPLKFGGDSGTAVTRKLGDQLDIKGGATGATTSGNIAVIADGNNTLNIQLAKNLTGLDSISTNGGNTVINDSGITTPKVTINNAPTAGTDATNKDYVDSTKTKVTSNDSSVVVNKTTSGNQDVYDLSVDVTKLDAANKSLSNINNDGNKVISDIARKSVDVVAGTNIKDIVKNDVQNSDGTTTTTYTINANGAKVLAGDGVTVATGTPGSNNITDYTVSVKNTTLTATPGSTTVTAGDNNSYAKAGDVATAITNVGKASKTTVTSNDSSVTVVSKVDSGDGHVNYDLSVDTSKVAANTNLTYKANSGTGLTTTLANGLDFKDGDNTVATVGPNGEVKYSLNPTVAGINSITTNGGNTVINDNGITTPKVTINNAPTAGTDATNKDYVDSTKTKVTSNDSSVTVVSKVDSGDGHVNYDLSVDTSKVAANTNLTYKANSGTDLTTTLANGLDFKDGDNTVATVGPNGEVKYSLNPTVAGINSITTNGGNTVINDSGITTPKVTINNAPTAGTDATNKDYVDSTKTKVTSNDSSVVVNKTTSGNQDVYDLSVDVTKLDAANKSLSNINNDGNKVISDIARKSIDVVAGTNIKDIVKNDVQNSDGTTTTTYTINANGARVVAGDGVTVATGTPGSNNITDYTVSVKNTTLTAAPGSTTVTAGDNNSYAKAGDVATAITNVGKASKTTVTSNDSSVTVVSKVDSGDGHVNYDLSVDTSKVAANTNLTYKANSGTGLTTTLANGLDFKDGDNTVATVGPNGEVKYSLNPTVAGINSITTNGGNTVINDNGVTTPSLTLTNSTPLTSSTGGKVTVPAGTGNQAVTGQTVANAINKLGDNTINLKASDGNITTKQSLNKDGGLEFNITGSNGITTTASGDTINVTIAQSGLNTSTTGGKTTVTPVTSGNTYATAGDVATAIQNAVNNSGWNAVAGSTGTGTTSGSVSNKLITPGETVKLQAGDNLNVDQSGGTFTYSLKKDISLDSVTTGDTKVANGGITIGTGSNQVSLTNNGLNNGGNKITNVAAGTNKNDAVNVGQLNAAKTELENGTNTTVSSRTGSNGQTIYKVNTDFTSIADAIGGNTKFDPTTGKIDTSAANIGGTGQTNISDAVKAAITTVSSNDASVTVNKVQKSDGHYNYDLSVDTNKIAANTNLTYKANSGTGLTTTLANGLDFKDGDNTVATVGPNGEVKYSLNPTVAGINSITTNGGNTVINDNGITTPSLTLTNSTPLTSSAGGKVTVPAGTGNQAVTGQTVANAINKLGDNTINLKASDGNITTKQSLNKDGGLEFNITGSNGITTTASGDTINVTIAQSGLNTSTTGGKTTVTPVTGGNTYATAGDVATAIQNAVNNSGWNAVAGSTGTGTTSGSVSNKLITPGETVKLQAGDNLNVDQSGGTFTYSLKNDINVNSITAGNNKFDTSGLTISDAAGNKAITTPSGTTYTNAAGNTTVINPTGVVINKSAADPSKSVSLTDNGLDNGGNKITNVAAGVDPTDAVNVSQLDKAINKSTYNGPVVYTNAAGDKIVKANNGNYYKASEVDADGNPLPSAVAVNPSDIQHSLLNADGGSTTNPSKLNNVGKGLISPASTQAINGSQLNNLGTQLGLTVDPSGTGFSNPTFAGLKNVNGSTGAAPTTFKDAVDQTIAKVNEGIIYGADNNTAGTRQQLGSRLTVESGDFASGGVNYKGQNLETSYVSDGAGNGKIIVGITENPEFNSVKAKTFTADDGAGNTTVTNGQGTTITDAAGNKNVATAAGNTYTNAAGNTTTVNSSGVTINKSAADPSKSVSLTNSGLDNGGNRITNIAAGVAPTDAVNVSQLGNAVNNLTTAINASKSEVIGGTNTTVTSSTGSNGQIVYKVDADGTTVSGGSSFVSVTQGTKDANNITDYKVDLAQGTKDKLNSIGTGNIAAGDNNTVTGSTVHNYIQNNPLTYTDDNGTTVTRNLGQNLNIVGRATGPLTTGNIGVVAAGPDTLELRLAENIDLGPNGRVTMGKTVVNDDGIKITGGPSVTSSGIDAGGKKVTNIAEGDISPTSNDAVTGRQVYNAISAGAADKATRAELAGVNNNLTAGIAGVAAMANLPQINDSASNRFNIAVAGGAYKNGRAMALGFSGVSDGGRFVYRASASLNNKRDVAVGLGVGYQFGKRDVMPNELDRMKSMVALIEEQKDSYSRQLKQQLEQESRKNQENSELIRQLMQEVQELKTKSNVSNRSNRS